MIGFCRLLGASGGSMRAANTRRVLAPALRVSAQRIQSRQMHERLGLSYDVEKGLGDFLPPKALKAVAEEYQQGLLERLNEEVAATGLRRMSVVQTIIDTAKDPSKVVAFNYACEALNNSFFLNRLSPLADGQVSHEQDISPELAQSINASFGSLEQLKSTFSAAVNGMRSQGYVWLLMDQAGNLAVYPTFGNGTLLVRSTHFLPTRAGSPLGQTVVGEGLSHKFGGGKLSAPPPTSSSPASGVSQTLPPVNPRAQTRSYSDRPASIYSTDFSSMGETLYPLFCVSVHEHAWLTAGYGIWGKEEWIKKFWTVVDWKLVSTDFTHYNSQTKRPRSS